MATKNIAITEEVYNLVRARKQETESFSDVLRRVFTQSKPSIHEVAGIGKKYNLELHAVVAQMRVQSRTYEKRMKELWQ